MARQERQGRWRARERLGRHGARWSGAALLCGAIIVALLVDQLPLLLQ